MKKLRAVALLEWPPLEDITRLLKRWQGGDATALQELTPLVYQELHDLAAHYMGRERQDHTLQPTALVNEAYLRLTGVRAASFNNRVHFFGAAATIMRRVLVDYARQRGAVKRRDDAVVVALEDIPTLAIDLRLDLVALSDALDALAAQLPQPARVVELRYFGGLSIDETAASLGVAPATVKRYWAFARAWLRRELVGAGHDAGETP
jgi:RNA polymerase sigma-70 factor, ECF subfamily